MKPRLFLYICLNACEAVVREIYSTYRDVIFCCRHIKLCAWFSKITYFRFRFSKLSSNPQCKRYNLSFFPKALSNSSSWVFSKLRNLDSFFLFCIIASVRMCKPCVLAVGGAWQAGRLNQVCKYLQSWTPHSFIQLEDLLGDKASQRGNILGIPAVPSSPVPPSVRGSKSIVRIMASSSIIQIRAHVY